MAEPLAIDVQPTPNPNAAKFTLNRVVVAQGTTYRLPVTEPEWAKRLLGIAGVIQLFALNTFVTVTKSPEGDWTVIAPQVERVLHEAFA